MPVHGGGAERGHEPADGAHAGKSAEAQRIAEVGEDLGAGHSAEARSKRAVRPPPVRRRGMAIGTYSSLTGRADTFAVGKCTSASRLAFPRDHSVPPAVRVAAASTCSVMASAEASSPGKRFSRVTFNDRSSARMVSLWFPGTVSSYCA